MNRTYWSYYLYIRSIFYVRNCNQVGKLIEQTQLSRLKGREFVISGVSLAEAVLPHEFMEFHLK